MPPAVGEEFPSLQSGNKWADHDLCQTSVKYLLFVGGESDCLFDSPIQSPVLGESVSMYGPSDDNLNFYKELMVKSCHAVFHVFYDEQVFLSGHSGQIRESCELQFQFRSAGGASGPLVAASCD